MPTVQLGLNVKSLAEVAWLVSTVAPQLISSKAAPRSVALKEFWQSTRTLQQHWSEFLDSLSDPATETTRLKDFATQVFTTELLARVWATVLGRIDQETGQNDLTRIASNAVGGLLQIRNRLVSHLLTPDVPAACGAEIDRMRRRCDRWTDMLIGKINGRADCFQFALNPDRSRDFAEEARESNTNSHSVELLVAAGVRLSFLGQLPEIGFDSPAFEKLIQSVLGSLPDQSFDEDGILQFPAQQVESSDRKDSNDSDSCADDVLLPGLSLENLKRRFE